MIVYKSRRFPGTIGSLLARYATKAMLTTAAKAAMRGTLNAVNRAVPHLIAHKVASTIANAVKKRSQEPQLKKAFVDTVGIYVNALIDGSGIVLD